MRATIEGVEIEGTPEEIAILLRSIRGDSRGPETVAAPAISAAPEEAEADDEHGITSKFAYRTLRRIPLSASQRALFSVLKQAYPDWTLASEIQRQLSWTGTQLGGVLGGLGRRLTATKGYKSGFVLWEWQWDDDEGEYSYRLPQAVIAALDRMGL
ncbi:MAG: hypothetical protein JO013_14585 [Alphaproteobacteria bacterium]|nr:hypothetical protein [Alphaproteobacteria bacterium]